MAVDGDFFTWQFLLWNLLVRGAVVGRRPNWLWLLQIFMLEKKVRNDDHNNFVLWQWASAYPPDVDLYQYHFLSSEEVKNRLASKHDLIFFQYIISAKNKYVFNTTYFKLPSFFEEIFNNRSILVSRVAQSKGNAAQQIQFPLTFLDIWIYYNEKYRGWKPPIGISRAIRCEWYKLAY